MRSRQTMSSEQRAAKQLSAYLPDSQFLRALGTEDVCTTPHLTSILSLRAAEEWERCICKNQAFSTLHQAQEGRQELIKKDGGEMLVSIVLDRPLAEAKALAEDPDDSSRKFRNYSQTRVNGKRTHCSAKWQIRMWEMTCLLQILLHAHQEDLAPLEAPHK